MPIQWCKPNGTGRFYWRIHNQNIQSITEIGRQWGEIQCGDYNLEKQQNAWNLVFDSPDGITFDALGLALYNHNNISWAGRLKKIMIQCNIWKEEDNIISRYPEVNTVKDCMDRLHEFYKNPQNHVHANNGQVVEQQQLPLGNGDNVHAVIQRHPAQAVGHQALANNHNPNGGMMPTEDPNTALATAIAEYLKGFTSEEDDGINEDTTMDEKLNKLYKWPINKGKIKDLKLYDGITIKTPQGDTQNRATATIELKKKLHEKLTLINGFATAIANHKNKEQAIREAIANAIKNTAYETGAIVKFSCKDNQDQSSINAIAFADALSNELALLRWFVSDWGGIKEDYSKNNKNNESFLEWSIKLIKGEQINFAERIASWSKVACIINPTEYAIYDSRVARTLNYIIYLNSELRGRNIYFPEPDGRNSRLTFSNATFNEIIGANHDQLQNVFISNKQDPKPQDNVRAGYKLNEIYSRENNHENALGRRLQEVLANNEGIVIDRNSAYQLYLTLLQKISEKLFEGDDDRLQKTEMLLFALADHKKLFIPVIEKLQQQIRANGNLAGQQ